jgi:hypothetical protein
MIDVKFDIMYHNLILTTTIKEGMKLFDIQIDLLNQI